MHDHAFPQRHSYYLPPISSSSPQSYLSLPSTNSYLSFSHCHLDIVPYCFFPVVLNHHRNIYRNREQHIAAPSQSLGPGSLLQAANLYPSQESSKLPALSSLQILSPSTARAGAGRQHQGGMPKPVLWRLSTVPCHPIFCCPRPDPTYSWAGSGPRSIVC